VSLQGDSNFDVDAQLETIVTMAKMFYSTEEVQEKLGKGAEEIKVLVSGGQLREFRDGAKVMFKVTEVDALAGGDTPTEEPSLDLGGEPDFDLSGGSSEIGLAPLDDAVPNLNLDESVGDLSLSDDDLDLSSSALSLEDTDGSVPLDNLDAGGSSMSLEDLDAGGSSLSLEDLDAGGSSLSLDDLDAGGSSLSLDDLDAGGSSLSLADLGDSGGFSLSDDDQISLEDPADVDEVDKGDTVVTSVGVNVLSDSSVEDDEHDDFGATLMAPDLADDIDLDAGASGSGLLDITREADDTSLGAELLEEIYPGGEEMGIETQAPSILDMPEPAATASTMPEPETVVQYSQVAEVMDPNSSLFGMVLILPFFVLVYFTFVLSTSIAGFNPPELMQTINGFSWYVIMGCGGVSFILYLIGSFSSGSSGASKAKPKGKVKAKKEKKAKAKKPKKPKKSKKK